MRPFLRYCAAAFACVLPAAPVPAADGGASKVEEEEEEAMVLEEEEAFLLPAPAPLFFFLPLLSGLKVNTWV